MKSKMKTGYCILWSACFLFLIGCVRFSSQQGVANTWRDKSSPEFASGKTTQGEVLEALGPPSQILSLHSGTVFYYLREFGQGHAMVFLLYNEGSTRVQYDRAVFFFDKKEVLTDFAYSKEEAPRK